MIQAFDINYKRLVVLIYKFKIIETNHHTNLGLQKRTKARTNEHYLYIILPLTMFHMNTKIIDRGAALGFGR